MWFHALPEKGSKGFLTRAMSRVNSTSKGHNSPGKALHVGESGVVLWYPIPEILEITDTDTDKQTDYGY